MTLAADFVQSLPYCKTEEEVVKRLTLTWEMFGTNIASGQRSRDGGLKLVAESGWPVDALKALFLPLEAGTCCTRAANKRRAIQIIDTHADENFRPFVEVSDRVGFRSCYSVPLISNGEVLGVTSFHFSAPGEISEDHMSWAHLLAQLAADMMHELRYR